jgi:pimeloyl-ACP methyl ester carboxylesterase
MTRSRARREPKLAPPSTLLLALEGRAWLEWGSLALAWPWLRQAPKGDGHPVLVLPGLVAGDASTWPLRRFLEQQGYATAPWELGLNYGPRRDIVRGLVRKVRELHEEHGRKVSLVGWSLGGALACALAARMPKRVRQVITLGSPLQAQPHATNAWRVFQLVSGYRVDDPHIARIAAKDLRVPLTAILSKSDGIVNWRLSVAPAGPQRESIEVAASHLGLGVNPAVLWAIADRLAQPDGEWRPFRRSGHWRPLFFRDPARARIADLVAR